MNDYICDHEWDPLDVFSAMSHVSFEQFLVQLIVNKVPGPKIAGHSIRIGLIKNALLAFVHALFASDTISLVADRPHDIL